MSGQSEFAKEFLAETSKRGDMKSMANAVGMPDSEDETLLYQLIEIYERKTGGLLAHTIRNARNEFEVGNHGLSSNKFAVVNKQSAMRYDFEFPESFVHVIEKHWPTMFQDKKHYAWLKKKLYKLMVRPNK